MSTVAYIGRGSHFQIFSGSTFVSVAQLQKVSMSGLKLTFDDITNIDSPGSYKEQIPVLIDPGDVTIEGILNPEDPTQGDLLTAATGMTLSQFKIILSNPDATTITFSGYVGEYTPAIVETTKAITFTAKITVTGLITIGS